jgi:hypothetical protein
MASFQTALTARLNAAVTLLTSAGKIQGTLTDDGTVGDSVKVAPVNGGSVLVIQKSLITAVSE